jgi:hypothetical protein
MPEVQHVIVAVVLLAGMWFALKERKRGHNPTPETGNDFDQCQRSYHQIKSEIADCRTIFRLRDITIEADDFFNNYYGRVRYQNLRAFYTDLQLSITVKRNKLNPDENSYA